MTTTIYLDTVHAIEYDTDGFYYMDYAINPIKRGTARLTRDEYMTLRRDGMVNI